MERRNSRNPSFWSRTWHTKGGGNFPGIAFSNFLVDIIHGLTLNLDSHEEKETRTLWELLKGQLVLPRLLNHAQNCLNNVFINLSKK